MTNELTVPVNRQSPFPSRLELHAKGSSRHATKPVEPAPEPVWEPPTSPASTTPVPSFDEVITGVSSVTEGEDPFEVSEEATRSDLVVFDEVPDLGDPHASERGCECAGGPLRRWRRRVNILTALVVVTLLLTLILWALAAWWWLSPSTFLTFSSESPLWLLNPIA